MKMARRFFFGRIQTYLDSIDRFCSVMLKCALFITLAELTVIMSFIISEVTSGVKPLFAVYIPLIQTVFTFAILMTMFALLFDTLKRIYE